jgi:putative transport protein
LLPSPKLNFRRAAERLHLAQPSLSTQIRLLEENVGVQLLERDSHKVVTRVTRAEVEFAARDDVRLQFGDLLFVVESEGGVTKVAGLIGNKPTALDHPHVLPVFVVVLLGVILGSVPIFLPGTPAPVRLGLAGGPLIVALVPRQIGRAGPLIWYL